MESSSKLRERLATMAGVSTAVLDATLHTMVCDKKRQEAALISDGGTLKQLDYLFSGIAGDPARLDGLAKLLQNIM